ncbi:Ribosomal protein S12 methylthiotransferase RimO [Bienertia sinuspersici]
MGKFSSTPAVLGRVWMISNPEMQAEIMKNFVKELAKEELINAYYKQEIAAATKNPHLEQVVEKQKPLKYMFLPPFITCAPCCKSALSNC